tara:strand:+ start:268 stop:543 length:276 start_codon:yes stop_codon:yes gene_type:complete
MIGLCFFKLLILKGVIIMPTGTVKWFNPNKGFGFIEPDEGENDVFVHITAVQESSLGSLDEGDRVNFDLVENRGKMAAGNLSQGDPKAETE